MGQKAEMIARKSEMVTYSQQHICNNNLEVAQKEGIKMKNPKTGMIHICRTAKDIADFNQASMVSLENQKGETEKERKEREKEVKEKLEVIRRRVERRRYEKLTDGIAGFQNKKEMRDRH